MLHEKTLLLTNKGYISISDIVEHNGEKFQVLNENNKFVDVIIAEEKEKTNKNNIYLIRARYKPYPIVCDENQLFLVSSPENKAVIINKKSSEITENDYVSMILNNANKIPRIQYINGFKKLKEFNVNIDSIWFLMGFFIGDG